MIALLLDYVLSLKRWRFIADFCSVKIWSVVFVKSCLGLFTSVIQVSGFSWGVLLRFDEIYGVQVDRWGAGKYLAILLWSGWNENENYLLGYVWKYCMNYRKVYLLVFSLPGRIFFHSKITKPDCFTEAYFIFRISKSCYYDRRHSRRNSRWYKSFSIACTLITALDESEKLFDLALRSYRVCVTIFSRCQHTKRQKSLWVSVSFVP